MTLVAERQDLAPSSAMPRHRHAAPYVAVVVSGAYLESGDRGRRRLAAGDVVYHDACDAHLDVVGSEGASVLNIGLSQPLEFPAFSTTAALDDIVRAAGSGDAALSLALLRESCVETAPLVDDWPDLLAAALSAMPGASLLDWAGAHALAPARLSAPFVAAFGVTPKRFRAEAKTRLALRLLQGSDDDLAEIAQTAGFFDQAHMARAVRAMTGMTPSTLRGTPAARKVARTSRR